MKRAVIIWIVCALALIGNAALADRYLFDIDDTTSANGVIFELIPGKVILTERIDGKIHVEGRVIVRNLLDRPVNYDEAGCLVGYSSSTEETVVVNGFAARPAVAAQNGYSLLTFSEDVEMNIHDDWTFRPFFNLGDTQNKPVFIGVGDAALEPYQGSAAMKGWRYLDDLPQGIYQCIILFADADNRFLWAEDVTVNTEVTAKISASLEDYEVELFRQHGKDPTHVEVTVQLKQ